VLGYKTPFEIFFGHDASATDACPSLLHFKLETAHQQNRTCLLRYLKIDDQKRGAVSWQHRILRGDKADFRQKQSNCHAIFTVLKIYFSPMQQQERLIFR
jgi:hypothetical protein